MNRIYPKVAMKAFEARRVVLVNIIHPEVAVNACWSEWGSGSEHDNIPRARSRRVIPTWPPLVASCRAVLFCV